MTEAEFILTKEGSKWSGTRAIKGLCPGSAVEIIDDTGIADLTGEAPFGNSKENMASFKSMTPSAPSIVGLFWNRLHIAAEPWGLPQFARGMNRVAKRNAPSHVSVQIFHVCLCLKSSYL